MPISGLTGSSQTCAGLSLCAGGSIAFSCAAPDSLTLDRLLKRLHANKAELLTMLDRPETPLQHRRIGERYPLLRHAPETQRRDTQRRRPRLPRCVFGLAKTCDKLGIAVWDYLGSRLKVAGHIVIQPLDRYVRGRFRPA